MTFAQQKLVKPAIVHKVFAGIGYGSNSFFNGVTGNIGYEFHFDKNFISLIFYQLKEFQLFGNTNPQKATELCFLYNREFIIKATSVSVGAGVANTNYVADIRNLMGPPPPGTYYGFEKFEHSVIGFPVNVNISNTKRKFTAGIGLHSNFNSISSIYAGNIFLIYKF